MTVDPLVYALAQARCQASGWNDSQSIKAMADGIQELIEEYEAEWAEDYEREQNER